MLPLADARAIEQVRLASPQLVLSSCRLKLCTHTLTEMFTLCRAFGMHAKARLAAVACRQDRIFRG